MAIDVVTMALCNSFTTEEIEGAGAIKGAPCEIASITETDDGAKVTFSWEKKNGTKETSDLFVKASDVAEKIADDLEFEVVDSNLYVENK